jgi:endo-1,4-beta-xylanase
MATLVGALTLALFAGAPTASAAWRTLEAEALPSTGDAQLARWAVRLGAGTIEAPLVLRRVDRVAVRMRSQSCGTRPFVRLSVDGQPVLSRYATSRAWRRYEARARIQPGRHVLRVQMINAGRSRGCTRRVSIDSVAVRERIPIGAAASWRHVQVDQSYRHALMANFDVVTPENDMKFDALEPAPGVYSFDRADEIVALAEQGRMAVHGHALVFDRQLPSWVVERKKWAPGEVRELLRSYIHTVVGRYRGRVKSWDVVNEPMAPNGSLAPTFFHRQLGAEYVELALRFAREADPEAKLYINEVAAEELRELSDGLFKLVSRLKAAGAPLDGVGFQFHANIGPGAPREHLVRPNLERFAALGLEIAVSEMDVRTTTAAGTLEQRLAQQADVYGGVAAICAAQPACVRFTSWGVTDKWSWLGEQERGLLFDWAGRAKPSWPMITGLLR